MTHLRLLQPILLGASALVFAGAQFSGTEQQTGPVLQAAVNFVAPAKAESGSVKSPSSAGRVAAGTKLALDAFASTVRPLSRPEALESAFKSYFAYKTTHPNDVQKPYLYFVDYGLPSTEPRGYVFDMESMTVVDGPFTVAHGRGSSTSQYGVPTRFANSSGANTTSLGLYLASALYDFHGHTAGTTYSSVGMRLIGLSTGFNDKAFARGVVAHGAPYVTAARAGRSQGCPAMEPARAARLLPKLANGGMVFLFAPNENWEQHDPWVTASVE